MSDDDPTFLALRKLTAVIGPEEARRVMKTALTNARVSGLDDADELLKFADALLQLGGRVVPVGRSLKIRALLAGASESPADPYDDETLVTNRSSVA